MSENIQSPQNTLPNQLKKYQPFSTIKFEKYSPIFKWGIGLVLLICILIFGALLAKTYGYQKFLGICINNLEPFSILLGLLGIILSVIIFIYVKNETDDRQEELDNQITKINTSVAKVLQSYTSLEEVSGLTKKLRIIDEIFTINENNFDNTLYIMTNSVTYGNLLAHQVKSLCEDAELFTNNINTTEDFYFKIMDPILDVIDKLYKRIPRMLRDRRTIKMMVLEEEQYKKTLNKVADNQTIKRIDALHNETFEIDKHKINHYFIKSKDSDKRQVNEIFIDRLSKFNGDKFDEILEALSVRDIDNIKRVGRLPFQFIATVPKKKKDGKMKCLVVFTNMYSGSTIDTVICFSSENQKMIDNLVDIYESVESVHIKKNEALEGFKNIFGFSESKDICFVLHETKLPVSKENPLEESLVRFRDDIIAEQNLKHFLEKPFKDLHMENFQIEEKNIADNDYLNLLSDQHKCVFNIGLFENKLTEYINVDKGNILFTLKNEENVKSILISDGPEDNPSEIPLKFTSTYSPKESDSYDIAVFAKIVLKINKITRTIVICGGCESYGTRKMGEYVFDNWKNKMLENKEDKDSSFGGNQINDYSKSQFISVYKIPYDTDSHGIKLIYHNSK